MTFEANYYDVNILVVGLLFAAVVIIMFGVSKLLRK